MAESIAISDVRLWLALPARAPRQFKGSWTYYSFTYITGLFLSRKATLLNTVAHCIRTQPVSPSLLFLPSWQCGSNNKAVVACRERKKGLPPKIWHPQLFHTLAPRLPSNNAGQGVLVPLRRLASCKYNPLRDLQMASIFRHPITQLLQQE